MSKKVSNRCMSPPPLSGFTLVEMMISVALVLLMMSMFAAVFVESTKALSQQRGISENDQRGRLLTMTLRGDLNDRTFRDVLPFRANEDTRSLGHSLARRAGYFEIDEGNPNDDTDDVLQFTASINIRLQNTDDSPYVGRAQPLSVISAANGVPVSFTPNTFTLGDGGYYQNRIEVGSHIWVIGNPNYLYIVSSPPFLSGGNTNINVFNSAGAPAPTGTIALALSENDPEFDDGLFGNSAGASTVAEVCYYLRNGILYRRVLLIRDTPAGTSGQPSYTTGLPILWNNFGPSGNYSPASSTFWRDFDYSAFYYTGNNSGIAPGVRFHSASESLSNSSQSPLFFTNGSTFPFSLGIPHWRFGHSISNGLPQDASTTATYNGVPVSIGRFNLQECANTSFGYPGNLNNGNPFDSQNIVVDTPSGLVQSINGQAYVQTLPNGQMSGQVVRRGHDALLANVLSFDVKVFDAVNGQFVDLGNTVATPGPFSSNAGVITDLDGNIVGGRLNSTYGPNNHYRFDTWHPNASVTTTTFPTNPTYPSYPATPVVYNEPPYYNGLTPVSATALTYNEPPYVPVAVNVPMSNVATAAAGSAVRVFQTAPLTAIQITINYRDISSSQIRQTTIIQSLVDRVKRTSVTNEAAEE